MTIRSHKVMDSTGHSTIEFDSTNTVALGEAMARFEALTKSGHAAATRSAGDADYVVVKDFKDTKDETLFVPAMQGG